MHTSVLWSSFLLPLSFAASAPQDPTCQIKPCPNLGMLWMPGPDGEMCGETGYLRCGAQDTVPGAPRCSCPSPQICLDPIEGGILNNNSVYWNLERNLGHLKIPSGYCIAKPCNDTPDTTMEKRMCRVGPLAEKCVYKVLERDYKTGKAVKSKNGYCLQDVDWRRCVSDEKVSGYHCHKGWSCIDGSCAPNSLVWE
jgi:hypothetical protein